MLKPGNPRRLSLLAAASLTAHFTFFALQASAQTAPVPIPADHARNLPVVAQHGMAVSQERTASAVAVDVMRQGGNAVDAAVALAFALAVTLPEAGNLGGGGFMLVHLAGPKKTVAIDYRELAPADTPANVFLDDKGNFVPDKSQNSGLGVGVPGTVAGMALALEKYGSGKFTLADLAAPAVKLARDGIPVDEGLVDSLAHSARRLQRDAPARAIFLHPDGSPLHQGETLVQKDLAVSLEKVGREGPTGFYQGPIAEKIVAAVNGGGGRMTLDDMRDYRAVEREPVSGTYRGHQIVSMPPPSSGGTHVIEILNILEGYPLGELGQNSAETIHLMAESMKLAYTDRSEYLGDPDFMHVPVKALTSKLYAARLRAGIAASRARPARDIKPGNIAPYESDQTTHFSVVDQAGNAVSNTYTLNFSYGVGRVAAGTGILLNNELDDFAAKPDAPNAYGLLGGAANQPGPRKRPLSSMSPTMVFSDGKLELVTGSPGGSRIITTVLQIILNVIDHGMNIAEASEAPRIHHQWAPDELRVERGLSIDTIRLLQAKGHKISVGPTMGSTQSIHRVGGLLMGAADTRQRGTGAVGY